MNSILEESELLEDVQAELKDLREVINNAGQHINSPMSSPTKRDSIGMCSDRKQLREVKLLVYYANQCKTSLGQDEIIISNNFHFLCHHHHSIFLM